MRNGIPLGYAISQNRAKMGGGTLAGLCLKPYYISSKMQILAAKNI